MRKLFLIAIVLLTCACTPAPLPTEDPSPTELPDSGKTDQNNNDEKKTESMTIKITAGGKTFTADIEDNETGHAFLAKLPLSLNMSELNGNEKYCYGVQLPHSDRYYDSIAAGDLMLYSGNCIVLFYGKAGGYSYTRIGKLRNTEGLSSALGGSKVTVHFEKQ